MKRAKFEKLMSQTSELPTLPVVAQKVIDVIQDDCADARTLTDIILLDPPISTKLLRLANSAYYRSPNADEVSDVHRAVVVLGFMNVRNVVLAACMKSLYAREFSTNHFCARDLWIHSVKAAVTCRAIALWAAPERQEEAFMAGLVHDIGMIVEWNLFPKLFPQVLARYQGTGREFIRAEDETLGFDHCAAGAAVLRNWKLPKSIRDAVKIHHHLARKKKDDLLPEIVHVAEHVCTNNGDGFFDQLSDPQSLVAALDKLQLSGRDFDAILVDSSTELERARDLLEL